MRELLHKIIEPVLLKAREDRESTQSLKSYCKALESRVKSLEIAVLGDQKLETIIENLYKRCAEIEGNRQKDVVSLEQTLLLLQESVNSFEVEQSKFREEIKLLEARDRTRELEIAKVDENIEVHKSHVLSEIDKLSENFKEMNRVYQEVALKTEEQANLAAAKATANSIEMGNYKREIDTVRRDVVDSLLIVKEIKGLKLNIDVFEAEQTRIKSKFLQLSEEIAKFQDEINTRDLFLDKYIPLQTAVLISDYLHNCVDNSTRKKLADYENIALRELNMKVLDSRPAMPRQERANLIINDMQHVEERKVEFQTKEILSPPKGRLTQVREKLHKRRSSMHLDDEEEGPPEVPGLTRIEIEKIVNTALTQQLDPEIGRLKTELKEKLNRFKSFLKSFNSEASSMQTQFMNEVENLNNNIKLLKSDIALDIFDAKKYSESIKADLKGLSFTVSDLQQLCTCFYEYSQIEQLMQKQDEEDRHNMAVTMEKEMQSELASYNKKGDSSNLTSANFSFQKKCLSCGTANTMFSGFRTSIVYHPSPLLYRSKKFERTELLGMKGQMLRKCWDSVGLGITARVEQGSTERSTERSVEKLSVGGDRNFDKYSRFSRLGSIDETLQDSKNSLPLLVSPTVRTRSTQKPKAQH